MPDEMIPEAAPLVDDSTDDPAESFGEMLAEFEHSHVHTTEGGANQMQGTIVSMDAEFVYLDIGYKSEGILPRGAFENNAEGVATGDTFPVSVKGRNAERYYELSRHKVILATDWSSLEAAFAQKSAVVGMVTAVVKGGLTVDIGVRGFMPASRSGTRDAAEMEKLVGQEITCRITKLDVTEEDVVVDRRAIAEEQARALAQGRYADMKEGDLVSGAVRSLMSYGAFVDLGGIDALLHISDIAWSRVNAAEDVLTVGQQLQLKVLKVDAENQRISVGLKQLEAEPWDAAAEKYKVGPARERHGDAADGLRRVRGVGAGDRRANPCVGDVVGEEGAQAQRHSEGRRHGGSGGPDGERGRAAHLAGIEAGAGRPVDGGAAQVSGGLGD